VRIVLNNDPRLCPAHVVRHKLTAKRAEIESFLYRGFDDALTELIVNDGGILGRDGDVYEGGRRICIL